MVWLKKLVKGFLGILGLLGGIILLLMPVGIVWIAKTLFAKANQTINDSVRINEQVLVIRKKNGEKSIYDSKRRFGKWTKC